MRLISAPPTITCDDKFKSPQSLRGGQKFIIDAKVAGIPSPTTSWLFNGQPLSASPTLTVEATSASGKLNFTDIKAEQSGVYILKAENTVGTTQAEFTLTVKGKCSVNTCVHIPRQQYVMVGTINLDATGNNLSAFI